MILTSEPGPLFPKTKAAGEVLTAKQAPHRPGTAPALGLPPAALSLPL